MSNSYIVPLREAFDVDLVGGKAINLAKLMQANLPVPDGFVVTTEAFKASNGSLCDDLKSQVTEAFNKLGAGLVAVRSSATAEDMAGASMAGQYETYLSLSTPEEVVDGIEKCWKSIRSERTTAYLKEYEIDQDDVAMAVVVQKLISADVAGVLFTVDPKTGSRENMLIEASWGLGEALVSGEVQPDVISVHSREEKVEYYQVAEKKQMMLPGKKGFQPVAEKLQKKACLPYEQIIRLQELGQLAVDHFGTPQDIEWAVENGEVYMLQTRAITTLTEIDCYNEIISDTKAELSQLLDLGHGPWVRHNIGETLPHSTPLTWELVSNFMSGDGGFGQMHKDLGFVPGTAVQDGNSFLKRIAGEVYMDCSMMTEMFSENYPFKYDVEELRANPDAAQNPPSIPTGSASEISKAAKQSATVTKYIEELATKLDADFDNSFIPEVLSWSEAQEAIDLAKLSDEKLIELWQAQADQVMDKFGNTAFTPSMVEALAVERLRLFLEEHSWDEEPAEILSILSVSKTPDCTMSSNIELSEVAEDESKLKAWLKKHGHRAPGEFELATPRWSERPQDVVKMAKQMSGNQKLSTIHDHRIQAAEGCLAKFRSSLSEKLFTELKKHVELVQRYCRFREDGKYYLIRAYSTLRKTALEFGRRLDLGEDIFFLKQDEMFDALKTSFVPKDRVATRKLNYEIENKIQLPHVIDTDDIETLGSAPVRISGDSLDAHSVSNGTCRGPVAIVHSPEESVDLLPGAILVCPSTDPSWTPLFVNASGLILERGGSLSHGAVVAREMGLPAVVLDGATEILKDGEEITIDANSGRVYRAGSKKEIANADDVTVEKSSTPPPISSWEGKANQIGLLVALIWSVILGVIYLLPPEALLNPIMSIIDASMWPLIRSFGMAAAVSIVAIIFALLPLILQKYFTDNTRLFEAKKRSALLQKEAKALPVDSPRRNRFEELAAPSTMRVLKASMVPLAFILGPMMMIFMWFPERVDPLSWSSNPGRMVSIVVETDGEMTDSVSLEVPKPLSVNGTQSEKKSLPPIRQELEELRLEWRTASEMKDLPWEVQSAGDHTRNLMMASLNSFLREGVPPQKLTWLVSVPESAEGAHYLKLKAGEGEVTEFKMVFGKKVAPLRGMIKPTDDRILSVTVNYPRALKQEVFWTPLAMAGGPKWDFGWLGVYLLVYLPLMFLAKIILRIP